MINIMLVAVADRTREIGLRKALGATNLSIMFQFFVEGAFLTLLSGGLGVAGAATLMGLLSISPLSSWLGHSPPCSLECRRGHRITGNLRSYRRLVPGAQSGPAAASGSAAQGITMKRDLLQQAYGAMRHDLRKTMLTMLGMAWGIATVVLLLAYGDGFAQAIRNIFESFGATAVGIFPGRTSCRPAATRRECKSASPMRTSRYFGMCCPSPGISAVNPT